MSIQYAILLVLEMEHDSQHVKINWDSLYSLTISLNSINLLRDLGCLSEGGGAFLFQLAHLGEVVVA